MRRNQVLGYSLAGLLAVVLVGQGVAIAQAPDDEETPPPPGAAKQVNLSVQEQVAQSDSYLQSMESMRQGVRRELEDARKQRDVVKTLCLNDKLNQLDVALRSAQERKHSLDLAAKRNDQDLSNHEFTILSVLYQRAQQLDAEARQCIGKELTFTDESSVQMTVDEELPFEDSSEYPDPQIFLQEPQCASCFR
jgi:hypothetical protein